MSKDALFRKHAPRLMRDLMRDLAWSKLSAAGAAGNAGHESGGFTQLQELNPTVKGSRGGLGWFQWTGPRRRQFEAFLKERGLSAGSYEGNYGFLLHELKGSEKATVQKVSRANTTLYDKVVAFELAFERAGVKHYPGRLRWAEIALEEFEKQAGKVPPPISPKSRTAQGAATAGAGGVVVAGGAVADAVDKLKDADSHLSGGTWMGIIIGLIILAGAGYVLYARWDDGGRVWPWGKR